MDSFQLDQQKFIPGVISKTCLVKLMKKKLMVKTEEFYPNQKEEGYLTEKMENLTMTIQSMVETELSMK